MKNLQNILVSKNYLRKTTHTKNKLKLQELTTFAYGPNFECHYGEQFKNSTNIK